LACAGKFSLHLRLRVLLECIATSYLTGTVVLDCLVTDGFGRSSPILLPLILDWQQLIVELRTDKLEVLMWGWPCPLDMPHDNNDVPPNSVELGLFFVRKSGLKSNTRKLFSIEDRGQTDRVTALPRHTRWTFNVYL